jgi:WD40 repeat protein
VAASNWDGTLTLWDMSPRWERATLRDEQHWVYPVAISSDGRTLATGGWDGAVKFWRTATENDVIEQSARGSQDRSSSTSR